MYARDGDMWSNPFQCEWCWLINLKKKESRSGNAEDELLLKYLRRMNLDILWSREPTMVRGNLGQLKKGAKMSTALGLEPTILDRGPWPIGDLYGCQIALEILRSSQLEGRHCSDYQQYDTI